MASGLLLGGCSENLTAATYYLVTSVPGTDLIAAIKQAPETANVSAHPLPYHTHTSNTHYPYMPKHNPRVLPTSNTPTHSPYPYHYHHTYPPTRTCSPSPYSLHPHTHNPHILPTPPNTNHTYHMQPGF